MEILKSEVMKKAHKLNKSAKKAQSEGKTTNALYLDFGQALAMAWFWAKERVEKFDILSNLKENGCRSFSAKTFASKKVSDIKSAFSGKGRGFHYEIKIMNTYLVVG